MRSAKSEMPQGTLDMVILQVVAAGPIHGYALAQRIRLISRDLLQIQQGSLYPALHRLENRGFLAAEWNESETGRDAKFYRLTPRGRAQLRKETAAWARLSSTPPDANRSSGYCAPPPAATALILQRAEGGAR
jgi:transcriptional regulator